ncbi:hypothetical protein [Echinicola jeungdonensis]|uniref:hypothetical protein n=1 Tax=Echinicola jeungdonensis TaxID=709343 RepID=UPI00338DC021
MYFRPGFQASYIRRDIGFYENLVFANQIDPNDPFAPPMPGDGNLNGLGIRLICSPYHLEGFFY